MATTPGPGSHVAAALAAARPGERWRLTLPPTTLEPDGQVIEGELVGVGDTLAAIPCQLRNARVARVVIKPDHLGIACPTLRWVRDAQRVNTEKEDTHARVQRRVVDRP